MNIEEVLELLEIDSPDEFEYFEHFAELIECPEEISYDAFYAVLNEVDQAKLAELLDSYFEEMFSFIPDDATDFFTLMTTIYQALTGLCQSKDFKEHRHLFVDELFKFRNWYTFESVVHCYDPSDGLTSDIPILEALVLNRLERLGEKNYVYDFTDCLDYPLEEYAFSLTSIAARLDEMEDEIDEDETEDPYADAFIDREYPVIDGEFSDDDESLN
ncbi:MAG TPA: hypothetical protein PLD22_01195 [Bacillota bacterium]|jgi:hypothetical protein|nr:hypothetical protein [Bacillota bacterium]HPZ60256.1 hypothetical protein [Bacillota bacterium]HQC81927.1 hypothetical protein [Bacillota bacterium]